MSDTKFVEGMFFKRPHEKAPDYIKGCISIKIDEFLSFVGENRKGEWMNIDLKLSKNGKLYLALNEYQKPKSKTDY